MLIKFSFFLVQQEVKERVETEIFFVSFCFIVLLKNNMLGCDAVLTFFFNSFDF